jgi:IS1 family transposase
MILAMNKLPLAHRAQILQMLCEGNSLRAVTRMADVSINTVTKLLVDAGRACSEYQDHALRDLPCKRLQVDEIWAFCYAKQKNLKDAKAAPDVAGDIWTWTAICADTKLIPSWFVGARDGEHGLAFIADLASRLRNRVQLSSDGLNIYLDAVSNAFAGNIDYGMVVKHYEGNTEGQKRYSPAAFVSCEKRAIMGRPDKAHVSTSYVERQNLTMRMHMRRFTRLTNGFSKKAENHVHAVSLHFAYYNFVRVHKTLRMTPAMAAGVTKHLWNIEDLAKLVEDREAGQGIWALPAQEAPDDLKRLREDGKWWVPPPQLSREILS